MKKILVGSLTVALAMTPCLRAHAWGHANAYGGGSTYHSGDTTTRTNGYGGEATHTAGEGTTASNKYGASASHAEGSGTTTASNAYGGNATHYQGEEPRRPMVPVAVHPTPKVLERRRRLTHTVIRRLITRVQEPPLRLRTVAPHI